MKNGKKKLKTFDKSYLFCIFTYNKYNKDMSINTSEGNSRYLSIIKSFAQEVEELAIHSESKNLEQEADFIRKNLYEVAERYGAGSIFPMTSEKIIEIVNEEFDGSLRVESKANQDINDGTDVKTAFVQVSQNSYYSSVSGLKSKLGGIRAILIYDKKDHIKFKYLAIPSECILNDAGERQDSINITFNKEGEISIDSPYWSSQCTFYEYCMLPESAFLHNYRKNEEIRKMKLDNIKQKTFDETKAYLLKNTCSLTELFASKEIPTAESFYNTKECKNDFKNFTEDQKAELLELSVTNQSQAREDLKNQQYYRILEVISSDYNITTIKHAIDEYNFKYDDNASISWFSKNEKGEYYLGDKRTESLREHLNNNKNSIKFKQFNELVDIIIMKDVKSVSELERRKIYPASRLRKSENGSFYFQEIKNWKSIIEEYFAKNKNSIPA